jgi:2,4-dienoyl-CoA reductase-like NADH-dependent reductase (Old Yellow Enzyme family)
VGATPAHDRLSLLEGGQFMENDVIFTPLHFRNLTVKNRIFRSNVAGRFVNYDGSGTQALINFEEKFARGGVGTVISSHVPIHPHVRILPNFATIERDEYIPFWRKLGEHIHRHDCKYIVQLSHGGRQQDIRGVENHWRQSVSSTTKPDPLHGFECRLMTREEIQETVQHFAAAARRVRQAGLDGIELHACNGYLFTQFLSSAINTREDEYGGPLENRARLLLEVIRAIRREVGDDFHLQVKMNGTDRNNAVIFWLKPGNTIQDSIQVAKWAEEAGADALHISTGSFFPHPLNPPGGYPADHVVDNYHTLLVHGRATFRNYVLVRYPGLRQFASFFWNRTKRGRPIEGVSLKEAAAIKRNVAIPVLSTGGYQTASFIRSAINKGQCDGVAIARPLIANNDLVKIWAQGKDRADKPCTYCNKCLFNVLSNPMGCYEVSRYDNDYDKMMEQVMSVFHPTGYEPEGSESAAD